MAIRTYALEAANWRVSNYIDDRKKPLTEEGKQSRWLEASLVQLKNMPLNVRLLESSGFRSTGLCGR